MKEKYGLIYQTPVEIGLQLKLTVPSAQLLKFDSHNFIQTNDYYLVELLMSNRNTWNDLIAYKYTNYFY